MHTGKAGKPVFPCFFMDFGDVGAENSKLLIFKDKFFV